MDRSNFYSQVMNFFSRIIGPKIKEDFWGNYKLQFPIESHAIESMTGEEFSLLSNKDAKEKVASLERLARNNNCSIVEVKKVIINSFISSFGRDDDVIKEMLHVSYGKIYQEAIRFNISRENTAAYYMSNWLLELLQ